MFLVKRFVTDRRKNYAIRTSNAPLQRTPALTYRAGILFVANYALLSFIHKLTKT